MLAAVLVGPYTGALCLSVVLLVQGLFFADGGLTALGVNVTDMSIVGVVVGYLIFVTLTRLLPSTRTGLLTAAGIAAFLSVPAAALSFTGFYAVGATSTVPVGTVLAAMVGIHLLIGIGEAAITVAMIGSVLAVRPDLVRGARHLRQSLDLRLAPPSGLASSTTPGAFDA